MCTCTSLAWGEEEVTTTLATGEEEPVTSMTTFAVGEEEVTTTMAVGEEEQALLGGVSLASTRARGEETPDLPCCCGDPAGPFGAF